MEATLYGVAGPGISIKIALTQGEVVTVGRSDRATVPVPQDTALSGVHFALELREQQVLLRDLGSTNGTFLNGTHVQGGLVGNGSEIAAGHTLFRLQVQQEILDPLATLLTEAEPLYAILDAAREPRVLELLRLSGSRFFCLHQGKAAGEMELVAPYLVPFTGQGEVLKQVIAEGWGKARGIFFTCSQPVADIWQQLRRALMVTLEAEDMPVYFRYYDPRVLRELLPILDAQQLEEFAGPIGRFLMEDEEPEHLLRFTRSEGTGKFERITVVPVTT